MIFKDRLKQLRSEKNISQETLSKVLGYTRAAISGYEIGRNQPDFDVLTKIAEYFNVTTDYLLGKTENPKDSTYSQVDELVELFKKLPLEEQKAAVTIWEDGYSLEDLRTGLLTYLRLRK